MSFPYDCECNIYTPKMLAKLDEAIYNKIDTNTNLYQILKMINNELCEAYVDQTYIKNDNYLWVDVVDEPVVKGSLNGCDCFQNWEVVEIISIGDTPGASDYTETVDFTRWTRGVCWTVDPTEYCYYPTYPVYYPSYAPLYPYGQRDTSTIIDVPGTEETCYQNNPYYPYGRKEPQEGVTYYVTYRYGCRDSKLYDNFGILTQLQKIDEQSYVEYRKAIKALVLAFLAGPTIDSIKDALSVFHPRDFIEIIEGFRTGWILGESILYTEDDWNNPLIDTTDGTLLLSEQTGFYEFEVRFHFASTLSTVVRTLLEDLINLMKPAHTRAFVTFLETT